MSDTKLANNGILQYTNSNSKNGMTASFDEVPFNEIDGLILSEISYMPLDSCGIDLYTGEPKTIADVWELAREVDWGKDNNRKALFENLANNARYKDLPLSNFVRDPVTGSSPIDGFSSVGNDEYMEQFSAVTITYEQNGEIYNFVSYCGTNGTDDGWSEDFAMLYSTETQAQSDSVAYMNIVAKQTDGNITCGGHSKGGNDAEYAFLFCEESAKDRIVKVYGYDSPGISEEVLSQTNRYEGYKRATEGTHVCPQDSMIGQLLHESGNSVYIHSNETGILQHDPYSWEISDDNSGFKPDEQSWLSKYINESLDTAVANLTPEERKAFFDFLTYLFYNDGDITGEGGVGGLGAFFSEGWKTEDGKFNAGKIADIWNIFSSDWNNMSSEEKEAFMKSLGKLAAAFAATAYDEAKDKVEIWFNQKIEGFKEKCRNTAKAVQDWVIDRKNDFLDFLDGVVAEYTAQMLKIKQFFKETFDKNYKAAKEYLGGSSILQFDTGALHSLAERLWAVNGRLQSLDYRLDGLYRSAKWTDLGKIVKVASADLKIGWSNRINNCANCLNDTAKRFEKVENDILNMLGG